MAAVSGNALSGSSVVPVEYYSTHPTGGSPSDQVAPHQDGQQRLAGTKRKVDANEEGQDQEDGSAEPSKKRARHELAAEHASEDASPSDIVLGVPFTQRDQPTEGLLRRAARAMSGWDAVGLRLQRVQSEVQVLSDALSEVHGSSDMHQPCCPSTSGGLALDTSTDSAAQDEHENTQVDVPEEEEFERPHWKKSEALWKVACKWRVGLVMEAYGQGAICETVRKEAARHRGVRERTVEPCGHESDWGSAVDGSELGFDDEVETEDRGDSAFPSTSFQDESDVFNQEEDAVTDNERSESESEDTQYSEHSRSRSPTPDSEHSRSRSPTPDSDHDSDPDSLPYLGLIRLSRFPVEPLEEQFPEPQWLGTPGWLPNHSDVRGSLLDADT